MTDLEESLLRQALAEREKALADALLNPAALRSQIDYLRHRVERLRRELER